MTLPLSLVLTIAAAHWYADFEQQREWMALNKSKWQWSNLASWKPLAAHVAVYAFWMWMIVCGLYPVVSPGPPYLHYVGWVLVNGALHFLTDMWTSRWTGKLWFMQREFGIWAQAEHEYPKHGRTLVSPWTFLEDGRRYHYFFVVIGLDQLIHYTCLYTTAAWMI